MIPKIICAKCGKRIKKGMIALILLIGLIGGFFVGRYDFPEIQNPFRDVKVVKNEAELAQLAGKYLYEKELADCKESDHYFYAYYKIDSSSTKNFRLICGYYPPEITIHEERVLIDGEWITLYCDEDGWCAYGERK